MFVLKKIRTIMTRMYDQNVRTYKSVHTLLAKLLNNIDYSENVVEAAGIEPASTSPPLNGSTCLVCL